MPCPAENIKFLLNRDSIASKILSCGIYSFQIFHIQSFLYPYVILIAWHIQRTVKYIQKFLADHRRQVQCKADQDICNQN